MPIHLQEEIKKKIVEIFKKNVLICKTLSEAERKTSKEAEVSIQLVYDFAKAKTTTSKQFYKR